MIALAVTAFTFLIFLVESATFALSSPSRITSAFFTFEGKTRRRGRTSGKTAKTKKAIVKLTQDSKEIEIFEGLYKLSAFAWL